MLVQLEPEDTKKYFGIAVWTYYFTGFIFLSLSLLSQYKNGLQFNGVVIFALLWVAGMILLITLPQTKHKEKLETSSGLGSFWMESPDKHVIWILPVGFGGVVLASYLGSIINNPLAGIFGSGVVMIIALFFTRSILIPIIIHGSFNVFVILGQSGYLGNSIVPLALNPSFSYSVPQITTNISSIAPILTQVLSQLFIVAPSEEVLKIACLAGFIVMFKGFYSESSAIKWLAAIGSLLVWTYLHYVQAI